MCGIAGFWAAGDNQQSSDELNTVVGRMSAVIASRGPDNTGSWVDPVSGIALGHRRLAILDLSAAGHQPMRSNSGRYKLVFNGEIYNHLTIRTELAKLGVIQDWLGHSDTETLLAAIEYWGVEDSLRHCRGMFALALWDSVRHTLTLARDRIGEKPLYYGWSGEDEQRIFIFASELKALRAHPKFNPTISRRAICQYLRFTYIPAPLSIYQGVFKLDPGCMLTIKAKPLPLPPLDPLVAGQYYPNIELRRWWSLKNSVASERARPLKNDTTAVDSLEKTLLDVVQEQSLADVSLGAFLSGGVDSSTIAALMQAQSSKRVKTFTLGFDEPGFDESSYARAVANHLGTDHYEMRVSSKIAQDVVTSLPWMYDEPFADSSQIPTHLVCKMARKHVTVALSGDGGDELFGGYNRYFWGPRIWNRLAWMPYSTRRMLGCSIRLIPIEGWDLAKRIVGVPHLGDKIHKLATRLRSLKSADDFYWSLVSEWDPATVVKGVSEVSPSPWEGKWALPEDLNAVERMMFRDTVTYLPDDILCKVDRAAMACSLETRVPLLDYRIVELAWRLPLNMKIRDNTGKWALREVLYKYVPRELIERAKAGFAIPIGKWLRGPLRDWAEVLLDESRLRREGYFHPEPIRRVWAEHQSGKWDHSPKIWAILMFQAWLESNNRLSLES
jgi:asparagine synthase (glutamine-hydrolysing)